MLAWKQLFIQRVRNSSLVERRCVDDERASSVRRAGAAGKENVGISNDNECRNIHTENPRFPEQR